MGKVDTTGNVLMKALLALMLLTALIVVTGGAISILRGNGLEGGLIQSLSIVTHIEESTLSTSGLLLSGIFLLLAFSGEVVVFYLFYLLIDYFLSGKIYEVIHGVQRMANLKRMKGHYIITGAGRVGLEVADNLKAAGEDFVLIDNHREAYDRAIAMGYPVLLGDCTHHDVLESANLKNARCVVTTLGDDPDNVFVTLAVMQLSPETCVISRAEREDTIEKLHQAGAKSVFMPASLGGQAMAQAALKVAK